MFIADRNKNPVSRWSGCQKGYIIKDRLEKRLVEMKNELNSSPYWGDHERTFQFMQMMSFTAGYAPDMCIGEAWGIVNKIMEEHTA